MSDTSKSNPSRSHFGSEKALTNSSLAHQPYDFERSLPEGKEFFPIPYLARLLDCSQDTIERLVDAGDLELAINLAPSGSKKSMQRITRKSLVDFLNRRQSK